MGVISRYLCLYLREDPHLGEIYTLVSGATQMFERQARVNIDEDKG